MLLYVKRSPRCNEDGDENGNEGEGEGEGETRLIKRRPPPSANGPTAQELHAGNCCANTTTFILQPLGKRIYYSTENTAPFSFSAPSVRSLALHTRPPLSASSALFLFLLLSPFVLAVLGGGRAENLHSTRLCPACTLPQRFGNVLHRRSLLDHGGTEIRSRHTSTDLFHDEIPQAAPLPASP